MDDKDKKDEKKKFPKEFEYLDEIISDPIRQIHVIEKTLKDLPNKPVEKAKFQYNPPGYENAQKKANLTLSRTQLERQKETLEKDLTDRFEIHIGGVEDDDAGKLREVFRDRLYPNPYKDMDEIQMAKARKMEKDIDHSQYFMLRRQKDYIKEVANRPNEPVISTEKSLSPAERFSKTLSSEKHKQNISKDKTLSKSKNVDEPQLP